MLVKNDTNGLQHTSMMLASLMLKWLIIKSPYGPQDVLWSATGKKELGNTGVYNSKLILVVLMI